MKICSLYVCVAVENCTNSTSSRCSTRFSSFAAITFHALSLFQYQTDPLSLVANKLASELNVDQLQVLFRRKDEDLSHSADPHSLSLSTLDIIGRTNITVFTDLLPSHCVLSVHRQTIVETKFVHNIYNTDVSLSRCIHF